MTTAKQLIQRVGETDQLFLQDSTPQLALERADLRLQLVCLSHVRQEQLYFLQEAIVLLEQARIEYDEIPIRVYLDLSLLLAKAYMMYFEITKEHHLALITQQILKPLVHHADADIYFLLAYASASKKEFSLAQHWLKKYAATTGFDAELLHTHPAFIELRDKDWFKLLIRRKTH